jgi:hypothetical protein
LDKNLSNNDPSFSPQDTNSFMMRYELPSLQLKDLPIKQKEHVVIDSLQGELINGDSPLFSALCGLLLGTKKKTFYKN